jgi:hypothetical protein
VIFLSTFTSESKDFLFSNILTGRSWIPFITFVELKSAILAATSAGVNTIDAYIHGLIPFAIMMDISPIPDWILTFHNLNNIL